jgi:hypothetical protein
MVTRTLAQRLLSPIGFLAVGCFFLLPFVTVSCSAPTSPDGQTIGLVGRADYSGKALVVGERPALSVSDAYAQTANDDTATSLEAAGEQTTPIDRQPLMLVALGLAVIGVVVTAWPRSWARALCGAALAGICALFLAGGEVIALRAAADRVNADTAPYFGQPRPGVSHIGYGFWLALALLVVLVLANVFDLVRLSRSSAHAPPEVVHAA